MSEVKKGNAIDRYQSTVWNKTDHKEFNVDALEQCQALLQSVGQVYDYVTRIVIVEDTDINTGVEQSLGDALKTIAYISTMLGFNLSEVAIKSLESGGNE